MNTQLSALSQPSRAGVSNSEFHTAAAPCPFCSNPGVYIRTRYFRLGQIAQVWTCAQLSCAHFHLYWHTDGLMCLPPVHPKCFVSQAAIDVMQFIAAQYQARKEAA